MNGLIVNSYEKQKNMNEFQKIKLERENHPEISPATPFNIAWEYREKPDSVFRGDMHYVLQICIVLHGRVEVIFDEHTRICSKGQMWWSMCWEPHAYKLLDRRTVIVVINVDIERLGECGPFPPCNWLAPFIAPPPERYCPSTESERKEAESIARHLFHLKSHQEKNWKISAWLIIHQLIIGAINRIEENSSQHQDIRDSQDDFSRIKKALNMVWNTDSRPPSLQDAAKSCALSQSRFSEIFRKNMGVSFGKFAGRVRMANAAKDLMSGKFALEEIAEKWGFFDAAHFCHSFRKIYKQSPKQFISTANNG